MTESYQHLNLLLYYRWKRSYKFYGIVYLLFLLLSAFFLYNKGNPIGWVRYEIYFGGRPCLMLFLVSLCIVVVYGIATLWHMQLKSNALHRYLLLPKSRIAFMVSEFMMNVSAILCLLLLQYGVFYLGYRYYMTLVPAYPMHNGLYLSMVRSPQLFKYLLPLTITQTCVILASVMTIAAVSVYLGIFYQKVQSYLLLAVSLAVLTYVWCYPVGIQFEVQRGLQLVLLVAVTLLIGYCFQSSMKGNTYGGR